MLSNASVTRRTQGVGYHPNGRGNGLQMQTPRLLRNRHSTSGGSGKSKLSTLEVLLRCALSLMALSWLFFLLWTEHVPPSLTNTTTTTRPFESHDKNRNADGTSFLHDREHKQQPLTRIITKPRQQQQQNQVVKEGDTTHLHSQNGRKQHKQKQSVTDAAFQAVVQRANSMKASCTVLQGGNGQFDTRHVLPFRNNETVATLPAFGIIQALQSFQDDRSTSTTTITTSSTNTCQVPPDTECSETQFTVVFMAYNPDRLQITFRQIQKMLFEFNDLVREVVLVWNGERHVDESEPGQRVLQFEKEHADVFRIVYPLKMGLTNDLMNRYHPDVVQIKHTKAIMYYDDDGPFYSYKATEAGFELWKRHANAQIGAMAREISVSPRQLLERKDVLGIHSDDNGGSTRNDRTFVSHCANDTVEYNFRYFANYNANMVLPSGAFLHVNYLCYLWHPALEEIRAFVRAHPVHPDDVTVSMVVSQLAGRAPRVYSRRLNPPPPSNTAKSQDDKNNNITKSKRQRRRRRLSEQAIVYNSSNWHVVAGYLDDDEEQEEEEALDLGILPLSEQQQRRSLSFGIDWDADHNMNDAKQLWADLRTEAVNALVRYFGSINTGSIGWCENTTYYNPKKEGFCEHIMAKQGWLPWMNPDGTPKSTCP